MTLLFFEGFDFYGATSGDVGNGDRWQASGGYYPNQPDGPLAGRYGGYAVQLKNNELGGTWNGGYITRNLGANYASLIAGAAVYMKSGIANNVVVAMTFGTGTGNNATNVYINCNSNGQIQVYNKNVLLGSASGIITPGQWCYIEVEATFNSLTGSVIVKANGSTVLTLTNVNTGTSGNNYSSVFGLMPNDAQYDFYFDDLYILDPTTGSAPYNTFLNTNVLGCQVVTTYPTANGSTIDFTPHSGANYSQVNAAQNNDGSTYNYDSNVGDEDLFTTGSLGFVPSAIYAVQPVCSAATATSGGEVAATLLSGATQSTGASELLSSSYQYTSGNLLTADPNTGSGWTLSAVNAAQIGYVKEA